MTTDDLKAIERLVERTVRRVVRDELDARGLRAKPATADVELDDSQVDDLAEQAAQRALEMRRARKGAAR